MSYVQADAEGKLIVTNVINGYACDSTQMLVCFNMTQNLFY